MKAFRLRCKYGWKLAEVASCLGLSIAATHRAVKATRAQVLERLGGAAR